MISEKPAHPSAWLVVRSNLRYTNFYYIRIDIYSCIWIAESHAPKINSHSSGDLAICMNYVAANVTVPFMAVPNDQDSCFLCEIDEEGGVGTQEEGPYKRRHRNGR